MSELETEEFDPVVVPGKGRTGKSWWILRLRKCGSKET